MSRDWTTEEIQAVSAAMKEAGEMDFEEFSAMLTILDFARTQIDGTHYCPRCGRMSVKNRLHTNALSRHASVYICDTCGTDEAVRDWTHNPLPLKDWAIAQFSTGANDG